ncbi:MAG: chromosomal replication initiator protein DnaA [Clostridiales bacterium]|jgi:chromosomal replication initiator protein|nr:chromosomal replication initiator protein DnaA [Clostridiales bacterium]
MQDSDKQFWAEALSLLEASFTGVVFNAWIKPLTPYEYDDNTYILKTEKDMIKSTVNHRYLFEINRCLRTVMDHDVDVRVVTPADLSGGGQARDDKHHLTNLKDKYVFESFVRGKSNELAYAACLAVSEDPGESNYNPLFLYGGVGLGKTHLLHSIGNYIYDLNPELKVYYVSSEAFMSEFVAAIRTKETARFKDKYRGLDVLLLDDVQFLVGKEETQEELFHTFNTLYNNNKQIVLTSDEPPKDMKALENRLVSRFAMGLVVDITLPDFETRAAILEKKAELERLTAPSNVIRFIAKNIVSNIRDLEGALNKVTAYSRLTHAPITMELTEKALKDMLVGFEKPDITVEYIQEVVASYYSLTVADLNSRRRTQNIVFPRQIAMYLSRKLLDVSLPDVGRIFGGRDHSTVIHGCDKITARMENDVNLQHVLFELENRIKTQSIFSLE